MTYLTQKLDVPRSIAVPGRSLVRKFRTWLRYRRNLREIASLDNQTLRDIGTNRSELIGHAWRDACGERCVRN